MLVWVAVGPFGFLRKSFSDATKAANAARDAHEDLWALQAQTAEAAIWAVVNEVEERRIAGLSEEFRATWIDYPEDVPDEFADLRFIAVGHYPTGIVVPEGFEGENALGTALTQLASQTHQDAP